MMLIEVSDVYLLFPSLNTITIEILLVHPFRI